MARPAPGIKSPSWKKAWNSSLTTLQADHAQFIESRKFQINEICRIFRVPPHLIGDLERATFSNIEQQSLEFVEYTLRPWLVRWEQELNRKLFPGPSEFTASEFFVEHNVDGLLRGDFATRMTGYASGRQWGWISVNDIREKENMNPLPDDDGDQYLVPTNMTTPELLANPPEPPPRSTAGAAADSAIVEWQWRQGALQAGLPPPVCRDYPAVS